MSWYDEDENESTGSTNDDFGFFDNAAADASNALADNNDGQVSENTSPVGKFKDRVGKKNFVLIICMLVGTLILVLITLIFGKEPEEQQKNKVTPKPQQQVQQQPQQQVVIKNNTDWQDATGATFTEGIEATARFTVTDYKMYMRRAGSENDPLEVRVEVWGSISGYSGLYKLDVPYATIAAKTYFETQGNQLAFDVVFKVGTSKNNKVIYDITPK